MSKKKILIITLNFPAPNFSAAGVRLFQLIDFFKRQGYSIVMASTADKPKDTKFTAIETVKILLNHSSFDAFVKDLNPDMVLFDRFMAEEQFGWRVAENAPNALRILDTEDLHSLRKTREQAFKQNQDFNRELWLQNDTTKREIASIYRCDLSLIISPFEMQLLQSVVSGYRSILLKLPFMVDIQEIANRQHALPFDQRTDFVFVGFGGHTPNLDAIAYLKTAIWPLIRNVLPQAKMHIYGGHLPKKIVGTNNPKQGFLIKGWTEDAYEVIGSARVMLAPLRFGAGLKGKLLDAMLCGTPSVTTVIGEEGMHDNLPWNGTICDDPDIFAQAAVALHQNKSEWTQAQQNGFKIIEQIYQKKRLEAKLVSKLTDIQKNLPAHRNANFTGQLLQHHTVASTKYMAKWIEEKHKGEG